MATLLIPGLAATPRFYQEQLVPVWRHGAVQVADHTRDDTIGATARRILESAPPRFALAGHSMGGYIALEIMRQAPQRVERLALLDTTARADTPEQSDRRRSLIALAQGGKFGTLADLMYPSLFHRDEPQLRQTFRLMVEQTGADAFVRQQRTIMSRPDSLADLPRIACPTLVLVGDADGVTPPERAREMAQAIPGARLVVVPDCGHMCALEQPAAVARALDEWLS